MAVITISRQYGSKGDEIAIRVAEMLGYHFFDKEIMAKVASEVGLAEHEVVDFVETDYKAKSFLDFLFGSRTVAEVSIWKRDATGAKVKTVVQLSEERSIEMVRATIQAAYSHGNIVILGRAGQAILKDMHGVLHVRIEASQNTRIQYLQKQKNLSLDDTKKLIKERDKASAAYLKRFYDFDWSDPLLYHLVINSDMWEIEAAAQLMVNGVSLLP